MKLNLNIAKLRGSIFTQPISYSPEIVKGLSDVLPGFLPSFVQNVVPGSIPNPVIPFSWELVNPNTGERIQFNNIKIDIIQSKEVPCKQEVISEFANHCSEVFCRILDITGLSASRLAIAPTLICIDDPGKISQFARSVYARNSFNGASVDNCVFNNVFRTEEKIGEKYYRMNYLANFYAINRVVNVDGQNTVRESIAVDFDINTFINDEYVFRKKEIEAFFMKASGMSNSFIDFYFGGEL